MTLDDRFHIGSDTKAMTALLAAMLAEGEKLRWDATVAEVYPELAGAMRDDVKCQIASNRDPHFASNHDPCEVLGFGLSM